MKKFSARFAQVSICLSTLLLAQGSFADNSNYIDWSKSILSDIQSSSWTQDGCVPYLTALEAKIDQTGKEVQNRSELKADAPAIIQNLWLSRVALHDRLAGSTDACATEIRSTFRKFRFLEDFLGEIAASVVNSNPDGMAFQNQVVPLLDDSPNYLTQKRDGMPVLQEGDLILARGVSFLSAMISRMGENQSQFSHVILVAKDPATGNLETIESYVDDGVNTHELHWAMKNENARLLVLRAKDQDLAKKAAQMMLQTVIARGPKNAIPYDYALNFNEHSAMSCAEVAQVAFLNASNQQFNMPERPSTLDRGLDLLKHLNITPGATFTPGDLEGDSRFDIVAEYRDLRLTRDSRIKDAIMTKMYEWMDKEEMKLHEDLGSKLAGGPIYDVRHTPFWPVVRRLLGVADFSAEIPRPMVETVKLVGDFGAGVQKALQSADDAHLASTGFYETYDDLYDSLEAIKSQDQATFANKKTAKSSIIFKYLRAN